MEQGRSIELLSDRKPETVAQWLQAHPAVEIVTRDRAAAYAEGFTQGAPEALQVADRSHLLQNQRDALERMQYRNQSALRQVKILPPPPAAEPTPPAAPKPPEIRQNLSRPRDFQRVRNVAKKNELGDSLVFKRSETCSGNG